MTDTAKEPEAPKKEEAKPGFSMPWGSLAAALPGLLGAALGAGWPGIIALVGAGAGLFFGINALIRKWNASVDKKDTDRAGADAGTTSSDIANQAKDVRDSLDNLEKAMPPKKTP